MVEVDLAGRVALVTGAGSGIGKASALRMAECGARVVFFDLEAGEVQGTVKQIEAKGGEALGLPGDITRPEDLQKAVRQVQEKWGRLDIVFANAGINGVWAPLYELSLDEWNRTLTTNLTGTFLTVKTALPLLKKQGGSVIITSSVNGTRIFSNTGATAYSSSKAGQVAFAKMIALELARDGIRVNVICPGAIQTHISASSEERDIEKVEQPVKYPQGKIPLTHGKPGTAGEVADLVTFLASDLSRHISGTEIFIDGAESLLQG